MVIKMTSIYYIEDDPAIGRAVKEYLEQKDCAVSLYASVKEARQAILRYQPKLVIMDWNLPDGEGAFLCRWIREKWRELPVIFLTVRGDSSDVVSGFQSGADDYVVKPFDLEILHSRILALLRRSGKQEATELVCDTILLDTEKKAVFCGREEILLSQSEYRLLLLLMKNKGMIVTRDQLLEQIWDSSGMFVNDNTLTVTIKRLREKLHQPSCLKTIRSFGYRMEDSI